MISTKPAMFDEDIAPTKEGRFLLPSADRRPAIVFIPNWAAAGMELLMSLVNPIQEATVAGAAVTPGHALNYTQERKMRGAAEDCRRQGIAFLAITSESLGAGTREQKGRLRS